MDKRKMTRLDLTIIAIVAICIVSAGFLVKSYIALPEPTNEHCVYEIEYIHISGNQNTKRVTGTCQGFYPWYSDPQRYKVPTMVLPFPDGTKVLIQGATDIISVAKITSDAK